MAKLFKFKYLIVCLIALAVIASAAMFSVSYAAWGGNGNASFNISASTGEWNVSGYSVLLEDNTVKSLQADKDSDGNPTGTYSANFIIEAGKKFTIRRDGNPVNLTVKDSVSEINATGATGEFIASASGNIKVLNVNVSIDATGVQFSINTSYSFDDLSATEISKLYALVANTGKGGVVTSSGQVISPQNGNNYTFNLAENETCVIFASGGNSRDFSNKCPDDLEITSKTSGGVTVYIIRAKTAGSYKVVNGDNISNN